MAHTEIRVTRRGAEYAIVDDFGFDFGAPTFTDRREADAYVADFRHELAACAESWWPASLARICRGA